MGNVKALCAGARELRPMARAHSLVLPAQATTPPGKPPAGGLGLAIAPGGGIQGPGLYPEHVLGHDPGKWSAHSNRTTAVSITSSPLKGRPHPRISINLSTLEVGIVGRGPGSQEQGSPWPPGTPCSSRCAWCHRWRWLSVCASSSLLPKLQDLSAGLELGSGGRHG